MASLERFGSTKGSPRVGRRKSPLFPAEGIFNNLRGERPRKRQKTVTLDFIGPTASWSRCSRSDLRGRKSANKAGDITCVFPKEYGGESPQISENLTPAGGVPFPVYKSERGKRSDARVKVLLYLYCLGHFSERVATSWSRRGLACVGISLTAPVRSLPVSVRYIVAAVPREPAGTTLRR